MFGNLGFTEILLIAIVALVIFGPNKLPELGRAMGKTIREFKSGARDLMEDVRTPPEAQRKDVTPASTPSSTQAQAEPVTSAAAASSEPVVVHASDAADAGSAGHAAPDRQTQDKPRPAADPRRLPE